MDDLTESRVYCELKKEVLDRTVWRTGVGSGCVPVVRQIEERNWMNEWIPICTTAQCRLWPVEQYPSIFFLSATNSLHLLTPSTWRSLSTSSFHPFLGPPLLFVPSSSWVKIFWASYSPPFSLGDLISLPFALLYIILYFLLCWMNEWIFELYLFYVGLRIYTVVLR